MKNSKRNLAGIAAVAVLCMFSLGTKSVAANTRPLNYPFGLAVDAKGNLYVANTNGNEVLVYNPSHMQVPSKRISKNVSVPTAVAFDGNGNLWVGNDGSPASVTQYSPAGIQNTNATLTLGITAPSALAVDGLNDLWVMDDFRFLLMFPANQASPLTGTQGQTITGVAAHQAYLAIGSSSATYVLEISPFLYGSSGYQQYSTTCVAMAYDSAGNLYCGNEDDTLTVMDAAGNIKVLANMGFFPTGLALDNARNMVYVADASNNQIAVYNTSGALLTTIK